MPLEHQERLTLHRKRNWPFQILWQYCKAAWSMCIRHNKNCKLVFVFLSLCVMHKEQKLEIKLHSKSCWGLESNRKFEDTKIAYKYFEEVIVFQRAYRQAPTSQNCCALICNFKKAHTPHCSTILRWTVTIKSLGSASYSEKLLFYDPCWCHNNDDGKEKTGKLFEYQQPDN